MGSSNTRAVRHLPENAAFHLRGQQRTLATVLPVLGDIIREGISQGVFATEFPEEAIAMILLYANSGLDELSGNEPTHRARQARAFLHHTELLLGAGPGSFDYLVPGLTGRRSAKD